MSDQNTQKWNLLFGTEWSKILGICPEIGGFLMNHTTREVILDENAKKLTEYGDELDYDTMVDFLSLISQKSTSFARLLPCVFYKDDEFTAGILRWHYDFSGQQAKNVVPIFEKPQLVSSVTKTNSPYLLALLEFSMSDGSPLTEAHVFGSLAAVGRALPGDPVFSAEYKNCFWVYLPGFSGDAEECIKAAQTLVKASGQADGLGGASINGRYITFSAGIAIVGGAPELRLRTAEFALYQAKLEGKENIVVFSQDQYDKSKGEYEKMSRFSRLLNENLFIYHFQPIVSARDGEVVAYEMLMRSDSSIGMFPLEILDCAEKTQRLYDIEKATISNALAIMEKNQDVFKKRKLYVNSITAHMLTDADWNDLVNRYGELMEKMVVEFTEQTELSDQEAQRIRDRLGRSNIKIAIDDFGTGYSNTSNLIKYNPDVVKIDRVLIEGIDGKPSIRKLVSGFIEFIHENGYLALAEGVETYEELRTMIQLGADLIQGFYVSKPKPVMLYAVSDSICKDIETINLINSGTISRLYHPKDGEEVDLYMVKSDGYNTVFIDVPSVTLKGRKDLYLDVVINVKSEVKTDITFENVKLKAESFESPIMLLGDRADVTMHIVGKNELDGKGILVPKLANLTVDGNGELTVISNSEDCFAIGADSQSSFGNIVLNMDGGKLHVVANGDRVTALGGGLNDNFSVIRILSGDTDITCSGRYCVGIGVANGGAIVDIDGCSCSVNSTAPDNVAIGSFSGKTDIEIKSFSLKIGLSGINLAGVGSLEGGSGKISLYGGAMTSEMRGRNINSIGTRSGHLNCHSSGVSFNMYAEGGSVSGIGDMTGSGDVTLENGGLTVDFRTGEGLAYGSRSGITKITNVDEKIKINA